MSAGKGMVILAPGRCQGALVREVRRFDSGEAVEVEFVSGAGPYKAGSRASYLARDLCSLLNPGDNVAFDPAFLRCNNADPREYKRRGRVEKRREGTLVAIEWEDGLGPQTETALHLVHLVGS